MTFLSNDKNNILDMFLWRSKSKEKIESKKHQETLSNYYKALSFEQIMAEADHFSREIEKGPYNLKLLKDALLLLTELEQRLSSDNLSLSLQVKQLIDDLSLKISKLN